MKNINDIPSTSVAPKASKTPCPKFTPRTAGVSTSHSVPAKKLLEALWRPRNGVHQISYQNRVKRQFNNQFVKDINEAINHSFVNSNAGLDSYFAMAEYNTSDNRTAANTSGAFGFWIDSDVGAGKADSGKGYRTVEDAEIALMKFCKDVYIPEPTHIVNSGGGLHAYWAVSKFINHEAWRNFAGKFKTLTKSHGFLADPTRTADIASVLRVPGTFNYKYNPPRLVTLKYASDKYIDRDTILAAIECAHDQICVIDTIEKKQCNVRQESTGASQTDLQETAHNIENVKSALAVIDPDCDREMWFKACCAVRSLNWDRGESLARAWSRGEFWEISNKIAIKYDPQSFDDMWKSINPNTSISIGTLFHFAKLAGWIYGVAIFDEFKKCETVEINPEPQNKSELARVVNAAKNQSKNSQVKTFPLDKYSLLGQSSELEKLSFAQVHILGELAILGQSTVLYAWPNTGKTLLVIYLLIESIKQGKINPSKLYYINVDDDLSGVIQKNSYAEEYGFHMLAEGHMNFTASDFLDLMSDMTANNQANGVIVVLDTLKKFANLMDKVNSTKLTKVVRGFVMKGGTVIALAHANKKPDSEGKPIFTGTTDILDDFDCAYRMYPINGDAELTTVEFDNIKRRGDVASIAAYSYSKENRISYTERLMSVQLVDESTRCEQKLAEAIKSDAEVISVVSACISEGINTKMGLADAVSDRSGISKRNAIRVIERYTGTDILIHKWSFSVAARGAKIFTMLDFVSPDQ